MGAFIIGISLAWNPPTFCDWPCFCGRGCSGAHDLLHKFQISLQAQQGWELQFRLRLSFHEMPALSQVGISISNSQSDIQQETHLKTYCVWEGKELLGVAERHEKVFLSTFLPLLDFPTIALELPEWNLGGFGNDSASQLWIKYL